MRIDLTNAIECIQSRHIRKANIQNGGIGSLNADLLDPLAPVAARTIYGASDPRLFSRE